MMQPKSLSNRSRARTPFLASCVAACVALAVFAPAAVAASLPLGDAANYSILYSNTTGKKLIVGEAGIGEEVVDTSVLGDIGVKVGGEVKLDNKSKAIGGSINFAAAMIGDGSGQFENQSSITPTVNFGQSSVTSALSSLSDLSSLLGSQAGTAINLTSGMTIDLAAGAKYTKDGITYSVFTVNSVQQALDSVTTIIGNGEVAVFNFTTTSFDKDIDFKSGIRLTNGLNGDGVLWNVMTDKNVKIETKPVDNPFSAFQGVLLAMNAKIEVSNANVNGRIFGGAKDDMKIHNNSAVYFASDLAGLPGRGGGGAAVPEPGSLALALVALAGLGSAWRRRGAKGDRAQAAPPAGLMPA